VHQQTHSIQVFFFIEEQKLQIGNKIKIMKKKKDIAKTKIVEKEEIVISVYIEKGNTIRE